MAGQKRIVKIVRTFGSNITFFAVPDCTWEEVRAIHQELGLARNPPWFTGVRLLEGGICGRLRSIQMAKSGWELAGIEPKVQLFKLCHDEKIDEQTLSELLKACHDPCEAIYEDFFYDAKADVSIEGGQLCDFIDCCQENPFIACPHPGRFCTFKARYLLDNDAPDHVCKGVRI